MDIVSDNYKIEIDCFNIMKNMIYNHIQPLKQNIEYSLNDKSVAQFNFKNGTSVHAKSFENAKEIIKKNIVNYNGKYWSNEIMDGVWEVQYTHADLPELYVTINASNGKDAAFKAYQKMTADFDSPDILTIQ
jgi:hypothetical protein